MTGKMPDFIAKSVREIGEGEEKKDRWTDVGVAFVNAKTITVYLDNVPLNGKVVLVKPEIEDKKLDPFKK